MVTLKLKAPSKYKAFIEDSDEFQKIINEAFLDFIELKQDKNTRKKLEENSYFEELNNLLVEKIGN